MTPLEDLKKALGDLKNSCNVEISAIVSRSGIPIAWDLPKEGHVESFATLSATIMGASEVIYKGLNRDTPDRVIIESKGGTLIAKGLGPKALLVVISGSNNEALATHIDKAAKNIREVLKHEKTRV